MGMRPTAWPDEPGTEVSADSFSQSESEQIHLSIEEKQRTIQGVLASSSFAKAIRLSTFLAYVCRLTLDGREDEINELNIGIHVFDRRADYKASDDTIVRTTARGLRQRLKSYYETEGVADPIRIDIPKGTYVPTFVPLLTASDPPVPEPIPLPPIEIADPTPRTDRGFSAGLGPFIAAILLALVVGAAVTAIWISPKRYLPWLRTPSDKLWSLLFVADRATLIVPADTTLLQYEVKNRRLVPLDEYIGGNFFLPSDPTITGQPELPQRYASRYTAVTSVQMAEQFGRIPKIAPDRTAARFARDLQTGDLNQSNAILIGAAQNNPWVQLFRNQLNFHLDWVPSENRWRILNDHPEGNEPPEWSWTYDQARQSYSHIALVHNLNGSGYVLILAGTNMFGSEAGSNFVFNPEKMNPVLQKALRSDGTMGTFEVLLQSNVVGTGSVNTRVAAARFHP